VNPMALPDEEGDGDRIMNQHKTFQRSSVSTFASLTAGGVDAAPSVRAQDGSAALHASNIYRGDGTIPPPSPWQFATDDEVTAGIRKLTVALASNIQSGARRLTHSFSRSLESETVISIAEAREKARAATKRAVAPSVESVPEEEPSKLSRHAVLRNSFCAETPLQANDAEVSYASLATSSVAPVIRAIAEVPYAQLEFIKEHEDPAAIRVACTYLGNTIFKGMCVDACLTPFSSFSPSPDPLQVTSRWC